MTSLHAYKGWLYATICAWGCPLVVTSFVVFGSCSRRRQHLRPPDSHELRYCLRIISAKIPTQGRGRGQLQSIPCDDSIKEVFQKDRHLGERILTKIPKENKEKQHGRRSQMSSLCIDVHTSAACRAAYAFTLVLITFCLFSMVTHYFHLMVFLIASRMFFCGCGCVLRCRYG